MASFSQQLTLAIDNVDDDLDDILRASVIALMSVAIIKTPIDKGRARNNWFVEIGNRNITKSERTASVSGQGSINNLNYTASTLEAGGEILLYNNLPYIELLEDGGLSNQAPNGMVRAAVASWSQIVESNK
jgi:hypothetical protein